MKLSEGGSALMSFCFTWLLNTPETYTHGFLGQIQNLPRRHYKVVLGVFAQLERAPQSKPAKSLMPTCVCLKTTTIKYF